MIQINWIELSTNLGILVGIIIAVYVYNKIINSSWMKSVIENKKFEAVIEKIKEYIPKLLFFCFVATIIIGVMNYLDNPDKNVILEFSSKLSITGLTLGAFSIAIATFINQAKKEGLSDEAMRYRHLSENFILSGLYFMFTYFFWLVQGFYIVKEGIYKNVGVIYQLLAYLAIIFGIIFLLKGMYSLLKENS
ncbi:MAG: hypothetical protein AABX00_02025 [Nanoarchaeota archaeon]